MDNEHMPSLGAPPVGALASLPGSLQAAVESTGLSFASVADLGCRSEVDRHGICHVTEQCAELLHAPGGRFAERRTLAELDGPAVTRCDTCARWDLIVNLVRIGHLALGRALLHARRYTATLAAIAAEDFDPADMTRYFRWVDQLNQGRIKHLDDPLWDRADDARRRLCARLARLPFESGLIDLHARRHQAYLGVVAGERRKVQAEDVPLPAGSDLAATAELVREFDRWAHGGGSLRPRPGWEPVWEHWDDVLGVTAGPGPGESGPGVLVALTASAHPAIRLADLVGRRWQLGRSHILAVSPPVADLIEWLADRDGYTCVRVDPPPGCSADALTAETADALASRAVGLRLADALAAAYAATASHA